MSVRGLVGGQDRGKLMARDIKRLTGIAHTATLRTLVGAMDRSSSNLDRIALLVAAGAPVGKCRPLLERYGFNPEPRSARTSVSQG